MRNGYPASRLLGQNLDTRLLMEGRNRKSVNAEIDKLLDYSESAVSASHLWGSLPYARSRCGQTVKALSGGRQAVSLEPRLSFVGGKGSQVHAVCACVNISVDFSVKLSGYYQRTRGLDTYTAMSSENTETKTNPHEEPATCNRWFSKD